MTESSLGSSPSHSLFSDLITGLSNQIDVPLECDSQGLCAVQTREGLVVALENPPDDPRVHLMARMIEIPSADAEPLLRQILAMNLFTRQTLGCTLGLDVSTNSILLTSAHPIEELNTERLAILLDSFIQAIKTLQPELEALRADLDPVPEDSYAELDSNSIGSFENSLRFGLDRPA